MATTRGARPDQGHRGYRNGYAEHKLKTAEGVVPVYVPELRDTSEPYRSRLMELLRQRSKMLTALALQMWARGLSTRGTLRMRSGT
ncbi:MAG: transposase [Bacillota bacterium]